VWLTNKAVIIALPNGNSRKTPLSDKPELYHANHRRFLFWTFWEIVIRTNGGKYEYRLRSWANRETKAFKFRTLSPTSVGSLWNKTFKDEAKAGSTFSFDDLRREFAQIALFNHWLKRVTTEPFLKFPKGQAFHSDRTSIEARGSEDTISSLHPCRTCGRDVAKSARACPHCGENLRGRQEPSGWRQKSCSNCGAVMSRFAEKCQQQDCGHPNTWLKMQSFAATLAVLGTGLWSFLHFQQHLMAGIALPLMATALALGWRVVLSMLKSFYGH